MHIEGASDLAVLLCDLCRSSGVTFLRYVYVGWELFDVDVAREIFSDSDLDLLRNIHLVLVYEDFGLVIDNFMLVALSVDYINEKSDVGVKLKNAIETVKSIVKCYDFGFDFIVAWYYFDRWVKDEVIRSFRATLSEVIGKLDLPIILLITKVMVGNVLKMFSPFEVDARSDVAYIIRWLSNEVRDSRKLVLNSIDEEFLESRVKLKELLGFI